MVVRLSPKSTRKFHPIYLSVFWYASRPFARIVWKEKVIKPSSNVGNHKESDSMTQVERSDRWEINYFEGTVEVDVSHF